MGGFVLMLLVYDLLVTVLVGVFVLWFCCLWLLVCCDCFVLIDWWVLLCVDCFAFVSCGF